MLKTSVYRSLLSAPFLISPARAQTAIPNPSPANANASPIPDVRGLEYRVVTLAQAVLTLSMIAPANDPQKPRPVYLFGAVHLWVLPAKTGETARGIGWDGVKYELGSVGELADWRADVEARLNPKPHVEGEPFYWTRFLDFSGDAISLLFLERLGAPELRQKVALWRPSNPKDAQALYQQNLRAAGAYAFAGGKFSQAKRQLQTLLAVLPPESPIYGPDLRAEAKRILADIARRETDTPRPTEEIAGLIWDLQNAHARQGMFMGTLNWAREETVQKLIGAGDRAIEPLLDTLENDERLTLSLHMPRFILTNAPGPVGTVRDAAQSALNGLLHHDKYRFLDRNYYPSDHRLTPEEQRKQIVTQMRADWKKIQRY